MDLLNRWKMISQIYLNVRGDCVYNVIIENYDGFQTRVLTDSEGAESFIRKLNCNNIFSRVRVRGRVSLAVNYHFRNVWHVFTIPINLMRCL